MPTRESRDEDARREAGVKATAGPDPIAARHPYYVTECELCGWRGSSEQCRLLNYGDDADVICPACGEIFRCDEIDANAKQATYD